MLRGVPTAVFVAPPLPRSLARSLTHLVQLAVVMHGVLGGNVWGVRASLVAKVVVLGGLLVCADMQRLHHLRHLPARQAVRSR